MTRTSAAALVASNFNPSCSCMAVNRSGGYPLNLLRDCWIKARLCNLAVAPGADVWIKHFVIFGASKAPTETLLFCVALSPHHVNPAESGAHVGRQFRYSKLAYSQRESKGHFVHAFLEGAAYSKGRDVDCMSAQVVVVTGASAGLGRAIAHAFAKSRARVGLIARNSEALEAAREEVIALGGEALVMPLDVSDSDAVDAAATKVEETFGPIDVWVNNAMVSVFSPVKEMKAAEYKRVTEVTYLGYVYGTLSALHRMLPRNRGHIIQVGSALAVRSIPLQSAYCACKHAIVGFTDSLRCELIHDKSEVKLSVVQMPAMNTTQFTWVKNRMPNKPQPVPPIFQPEVAAAVVLHAALTPDPRREYFVGSPTVEAIQAQKIIPGVLDYYLGKTGYKSQQTDEPESPDPPDNLWNYVPGKHQAHGPFDARAHTFSSQVFVDLHRGWFALGALAIFSGVMGAVALGSKRGRRD